jgi:molybdenum cofactor cytidylyltransferase
VEPVKIGCVVMAAGSATRFGGKKLEAQIEGRTLFRRALDAVPKELFAAVIVVVQDDRLCPTVSSYGYMPLVNLHPEWGASHTIALGLTALKGFDAVLFQVADQPFLRRASVVELVEFYRSEPLKIAALGHGGVRGNPCLFPRKFFPELFALTGDCGGNTVIRQHESELRLYEVPARELSDVDTPAALEALKS